MPLIKIEDINQLIEMIKTTSRISAFVLQALVCESYPKRLFWMEGRMRDLAFCLDCPSVRNEEWTQEVQKIFMDYTAFTNRSKAEDKCKRTVFLNALSSKTPYIKIDKSDIKHKKYCHFTKKFEELANSKLEEILSHNAAAVQTTENSSISIVNVLEDFMSQSTVIESIPTSIDLGEDISAVYGQVNAIPMETESSVPNISIMEATEDPLPFYDKVSFNTSSCSIDGDLTNRESSTSFSVGEESFMEYPSNDPAAFLCSQEKTNILPQKSVESDLKLFKKVNSLVWDIHDIHSIKIVGNQVHILEQIKKDSCFPLPSSDHFMLTLKTPI